MKWILLGLMSVTDYGFLNYGLGSVTVHKPGSPTARQHLSRKFITNTYRHWYLYDPSWWIMSSSPTATGDSQKQVTHKNKLSPRKKYTTLNNTCHTANTYAVWFYIPRHQNLRACLTLVIQEGKFYHYQSGHATCCTDELRYTASRNTRATTSFYRATPKLLTPLPKPELSSCLRFWGGEEQASSTQFQLLSLGGTYIQVATVWECGATCDSVFIYFRLLRSRHVKSTDQKILVIGLQMMGKEAAMVALEVLLKHMSGGL
jgi:hypothetical protein